MLASKVASAQTKTTTGSANWLAPRASTVVGHRSGWAPVE